MSLRNIGIVYGKELMDSLRDRRTLISMVVVPLVLMPLLTIGMGTLSFKLMGKAAEEIPEVMILGGADSPRVTGALRKLKGIRVVPTRPDYAEQISNKKVRAAVEIPRDFDARLERGETATVKIYKYEGEMKSGFGAQRVQQFFRDLRDRTVRDRLEAHRLPQSLVQPFEIKEQNVAPPEKVGGTIFGGIVPYFIILLSMTGAMYPAMDLTAGEKERGTMETILCSPVSRTHLVLGKFLMVLTASLSTAVLAISSMSASFLYARAMLGRVDAGKGPGFAISINPKAVLAVFLMVLPLAMIFSAALLTIALFAKSYKEAQSYVSPLMILVVLPAVAGLLPGVDLNARLALVPILNTTLVSKEIITGTYHWRLIALIFASSCAYAAAALFLAVKMFQREDVLFRT